MPILKRESSSPFMPFFSPGTPHPARSACACVQRYMPSHDRNELSFHCSRSICTFTYPRQSLRPISAPFHHDLHPSPRRPSHSPSLALHLTSPIHSYHLLWIPHISPIYIHSPDPHPYHFRAARGVCSNTAIASEGSCSIVHKDVSLVMTTR